MATETVERYKLASRIVCRGGEYKELHFLHDERNRMLPVVHEGQLIVCEWGNWSGGKLQRIGWCSQESIEAGNWRWLEPQQIEIPANYGYDRGVWYQVTQGVRGVLVRDEHDRPHAYILTVPATHYYKIMTRSSRMPVLIEQEI